MKAAADRLGLTVDAVISAITRGKLTELIDPEPLHRFKHRRFVLRSEVEEMAERRQRAAEKWGEMG